MPVTQWFTDTVPGERLGDAITVVVGDQQARIPISDLDRGDRVRAVLDCTGGWYAAQDWAGVRLDRLLSEVTDEDLPEDGSIDVISRTGYRRRLPLRDASSLLLATSAAGQPLSDGHGAPVRLVAPGRRGFWWVKWVERVEVERQRRRHLPHRLPAPPPASRRVVPPAGDVRRREAALGRARRTGAPHRAGEARLLVGQVGGADRGRRRTVVASAAVPAPVTRVQLSAS